MNILVVCHYGLYRDLGISFVHAQTKEYAQMGHHVRVIVPIPVGKRDWRGRRFSLSQWKQEDGVEIYGLRFLSLSNRGKTQETGKQARNTIHAIHALQRKLQIVLDNFSPDVIHAHTLGFDSDIGAWLKDRLGIPLAVTTHGGDTFVPFTAGHLDQLKQYADKADTVVCVSSLLKKRLMECGVSAPAVTILNGSHLEHVTSLAEKEPISLIQVGYLIARKKADVTIRAFAALRACHPEASLRIVGSGSELERFQTLCRELNVTNSVYFLGFLPNTEALAEIAKSRFFVMPSVREGFGIVYLEAMASGCITIGTEGEGIADLIVSGKNGFLVPPDNPETIVNTIEWCLTHPEEASVIAERGRMDALNLTWAENALQYVKLFEELKK